MHTLNSQPTSLSSCVDLVLGTFWAFARHSRWWHLMLDAAGRTASSITAFRVAAWRRPRRTCSTRGHEKDRHGASPHKVRHRRTAHAKRHVWTHSHTL